MTTKQVTQPGFVTDLLTMGTQARYLVGTTLSLGIGFTQLALFFPDNEPGLVFLLIGIASMLGGASLGLLVSRTWVLFCIVACWGSTLAGLVVMQASGFWLGFSLVGVGTAAVLFGGALGAAVRRRLEQRRGAS